MAKTKHGLPETKGNFQLRGIVTGMNRENAFKNQTFTKSERNTLNLGVKTDEISSIYTTIEGFKSEKAYLFKQSETKGEKPQQKIVDWDNRYDYEEDGFFVIGTRVGLEKGEDGKNIITTLTGYDAAKDVKSSLEDGTSVFIKGKIDYSSFKNREGDKIQTKKLLVDSLYLNSKEIDFDDEDYSPLSDFQQRLIFISIEKDTKEDKFFVEGKVVTRDSIENAEFVIYDKSLANTIKRQLKPYTAITVSGSIKCSLETEDVEEKQEVWGKTNSFTKVNKPVIREYVIEGANPETIDNETYTKEILEEAIRKLNEEGLQKSGNDNGDWGKSTEQAEIDTDDLPW